MDDNALIYNKSRDETENEADNEKNRQRHSKHLGAQHYPTAEHDTTGYSAKG